jgi:hypothetical protein
MWFAFNLLALIMDPDNTKKPGQTPEPSPTSERKHAGTRPGEEVVSVRLLRKYAANIDGVNLEDAVVGDRLDLSPRDASILIAEGWAIHVDDERAQRLLPRALAADSSRRSRKKSKT